MKPFKNGFHWRKCIRVMVNLDVETAEGLRKYIESHDVTPATSAAVRKLVQMGLAQVKKSREASSRADRAARKP